MASTSLLVGATSRPVTPSETRLALPVAPAATTGNPLAMASRVTLPKVSVTLGLKKMSPLASACPSASPVLNPAKIAPGRLAPNQPRAGPSPITSTLCGTPRARSWTIVSANTSRPFSITSRPRNTMATSVSASPSERRHSGSRCAEEKIVRSTPRLHSPISACISIASSSSIMLCDGATSASQRV